MHVERILYLEKLCLNCQKQNGKELPYKLFNCFRDFSRDLENCDADFIRCLSLSKVTMRRSLRVTDDFQVIRNKNKARNYPLMAKYD